MRMYCSFCPIASNVPLLESTLNEGKFSNKAKCYLCARDSEDLPLNVLSLFGLNIEIEILNNALLDLSGSHQLNL